MKIMKRNLDVFKIIIQTITNLCFGGVPLCPYSVSANVKPVKPSSLLDIWIKLNIVISNFRRHLFILIINFHQYPKIDFFK